MTPLAWKLVAAAGLFAFVNVATTNLAWSLARRWSWSRARAGPGGGPFSALSDADLEAARRAIDAERARRAPAAAARARERPRFLYAHKKTYATSDPEAAALFLRDHFGAVVDIFPINTTCADGGAYGYTHTAGFPPTADQPRGFTIHFVYNPRKAPGAGAPPGVGGNATLTFERIERWRGDFGASGLFDQWMDDHLGIAFESLDPLVRGWQADGVPFICRTWCCGPGMPQWPDECPPKDYNNTGSCEQGCYVQAPHGLIIEALCGLGGGLDAARKCLTLAEPEVFDLCSST